MDLDFPCFCADCSGDEFCGEFSVDVEAHGCAFEVGGLDVVCALEAALFADGEEEGDGWVGDVVFEECFGECDEYGATCAVVAAECGVAFWDDAVAVSFWLCACADGHHVEVRCEEDSVAFACAGEVDVEVSGLCWEFDFFVCVVESDCGVW